MGRFIFEEVCFDSDFDSGNLSAVEKAEEEYLLWISHDDPNTRMSSWFHFRVEAPEGRTLSFRLKNLARILSILKFGMRPVVKSGGNAWERIEEITYCKGESGTEIQFAHTFTSSEASFAFTYPWSYSEDQRFLDEIQPPDHMYFFRKTLTQSVENRNCDVLVISSKNSMAEDNDYGWKNFHRKQIAVVSARVHPGETASSYVCKGLIQFLMTEAAREILDRFVFLILPMLNPDGVHHGFMRFDTLCQNLNRCYSSPNPNTQPTIHALKELILYFKEQVYCFVDLHAHMVIKGIFMFGNFMNDFKQQIEVCAIPKLMTLTDPHFHMDYCNFSDAGMKASDKRGESKEGTGRVAIYKETGILRCYTLECNYHSGVSINIWEDGRLVKRPSEGRPGYTIPIFENTGRALGLSISQSADIEEDFQIKVAQEVAKIVPYRFYNHVKKAAKDSKSMRGYLANLNNESNY